ncbi:MAG: hypothetical protein GY952_05555 [Rhodobacteraceae bacterium]|nr:hypothetical protein [Paracoccaceae bacterium]
MILRLAPLFLALSLLATSALADLRLLMFEQAGCYWCERWNEEIAEVYPKTSEGIAAPLQRTDIHEKLPDQITLSGRPVYTPTFVLVRDGIEIGRIEGYPGEDFFWSLLEIIMKPLPEYVKPEEDA